MNRDCDFGTFVWHIDYNKKMKTIYENLNEFNDKYKYFCYAFVRSFLIWQRKSRNKPHTFNIRKFMCKPDQVAVY